MPLIASYSKSLITQAATTESLTAPQTKAILAAAPAGWLPTLVARANDPASNGASIADWKTAYPTILGSLSDTDASLLVRIAVAAAGGVAV